MLADLRENMYTLVNEVVKASTYSENSVSRASQYLRKKKLCNAYGALQGAVSYTQNTFRVSNIAYGGSQGAVSVAEFVLPPATARAALHCTGGG